MSVGLTSNTRIKDRLQITSANFDTLISNLIIATTKRIEQMCGRTFSQDEYENELYDGSDAYNTPVKNLIIKNAPIVTLESLEYKTGSNSNPTWVEFNEDDYDINLSNGILYFHGTLPKGKQNIRATYTGGYVGYFVDISQYWEFDVVPTGTVNGVNLTFTLPEAADEVVVYADGLRVSSGEYSFTAGGTSIVFESGAQPNSSISVDYLPTSSNPQDNDVTLPSDLVEVCEEVVIRLFKKRDSEGRASESFGESSITWNENVFTPENITTIKNYRRVWL